MANRSLQWATTDGSFSGSGPYTTSNVDVNSSGTYALTITDNDNGCQTTKSVLVNDDIAAPDITIDPAPAEKITCTNADVQLYGTSTTTGASLLWTGTGNITDPTSETPVVDAAGTYTLTVTGDNGCTATGTTEVLEEKTIPTSPVILSPDKITCAVPKVQLKISPVDPNVDYLWTTTGTGTISDIHSDAPWVDAIGTYTVTAIHHNSGCTSQSGVTVTENKALPTPVIAAGPYQLTCAAPTATLDGSGSVGVNPVWTASMGGHIISGKNTFKPVVNATGTYTLTVANATTGCKQSTSVNVTADAAMPGIDFDPYPVDLTCNTTSVTLYGKPTEAGTTYSWTASPGHFVIWTKYL